MRELDVLEKTIVRAWSAVVANGLAGDPSQVTEAMKDAGTTIPMADVAKKMIALRSIGALPPASLEVA